MICIFIPALFSQITYAKSPWYPETSSIHRAPTLLPELKSAGVSDEAVPTSTPSTVHAYDTTTVSPSISEAEASANRVSVLLGADDTEFLLKN